MAIKLKVSETSAKLKATSTDALQFGVEQGIPIYPDPYEGKYEVTPSETEQTLLTNGLMMTDDVTIEAIPSDYVGSVIDRRDSSNLTSSGATVSVPSGFYEENASKSIPSGTVVPANAITAVGATLTASINKLSLYRECINAPYVSEAGYIESGTQGKTQITLTADVNTRTSSDLTASGNTVTAPAGYYGSSASKSVQSGSATTPTGGITANPSISVDSNGLITASVNKSESITPIINEGYVTSGTAGTVSFSGSNTQQLPTQAGTTITPTTSEQTAVPAGKFTTGAVKVSAVPSAVVRVGDDYKFITDNNVRKWKSAPFTYAESEGFVEENVLLASDEYVFNAVPSGTTITPSTSSQTIGGANYMMEGAVTVSAVPLADVSVVEDYNYITENGSRKWEQSIGVYTGETGNWVAEDSQIAVEILKYNAIAKNTSVTPTESAQTIGGANTMMEGAVTVNAIPSNYVGSGVTQRSSLDLSASGATVTVPSGHYASQATKSVASGTEGTPTATKGTVSNHSISVTPSVTNTAGYISGGTHSGTAVSVSASELVSGSETKTANGTYDVTNLAQLVVNVSGGGSSNFTLLGTKSLGTISTSSTTDTDTGQTIVLTGWNDYDLLICECSVNTKTNGRHAESTRLAWLTASSTVATKNGCTFATATHNTKLSSSGTATTRSNTTPYGVYAKAGTISGSNLTLTIYQRYNSTQTGTINGSYTMRVYGCKIYDLIGG